MEIILNGQPTPVPAEDTLAALLQRHELTPQRVAIEVNEQLVKRAAYAETVLRPGDRVEIVTLVGGG